MNKVNTYNPFDPLDFDDGPGYDSDADSSGFWTGHTTKNKLANKNKLRTKIVESGCTCGLSTISVGGHHSNWCDYTTREIVVATESNEE